MMKDPSITSSMANELQSLPATASATAVLVLHQHQQQQQQQNALQERASTMVLDRWLCDICKEVSYEDYDDACRHEANCTGPTKQEVQVERGPLVQPVPVVAPPVSALQAQAPLTQSSSSQTYSTTASSKDAKQTKITRDVSPDPSPSAACKHPRHCNDSSASARAPPTASDGKPEADSKSVHSFFVPRKTAKRPTAPAQPTHSFFRPDKKTKQAPKTGATDEGVVDEEVQILERQKPVTSKQKKAQSTSRESTKALEKSCQALAAAIDSHAPSAPLAGIFSNKPMQQLIAEQRQAEFQAKRRIERQKELERQQKRAAARSGTPSASSHPKPAQPLPAHCRLPMAPRFPNHSHVSPPFEAPNVARDDACHWLDITQKSGVQEVPVSKRQEASCTDAATVQKLISSPSDLDASEDNRDLLQEALSDVFNLPQPQSQTVGNKSLWNHRYGHHDSIQNIVGESTKQAAKTLQEWIHDWCATRQRALDRMKERQQLLKKKKAKKSKTVYKEDSEDEGGEEEDLAKVYLLTGPPASGKTGLVHAVAKACHCSVLEINTTAVRSASSLKNSIQEATQSCSTSDLFQNQRQQESLMMKVVPQQQETVLQDSQDDDDYSLSDEEAFPKRKAGPTTSLTVILIDEVDLIFEAQGDAGFWAALSSLAKTARCPILLTANRFPPGMSSISHRQLPLSRPSPVECSDKILQVCQQEGITMRSGLGPAEIRERLAWIATVCQCDLRKILLQLQLYHTTHVAVRNSGSSPPTATPKHESSESFSVPNASRNLTPLPVLHSVVPNCVPADKYTILTIHGAHFHSLLFNSSRDIAMQLGEEACQARVMDDETILALCPPCPFGESPSRRIVNFSISSTPIGKLDGVSVRSEILLDGSILQGTMRLYVEYLIPGEDEEANDSGEHEWEESTATQNPLSNAMPLTSLPTLEQGLELWNKALQEEANICCDSKQDTLPDSNADKITVKQLDELSLGAQYSSDAACLEDLHRGYPLLSGACRGFGFDLTEEGGSTGGGKLRLNDNCRP